MAQNSLIEWTDHTANFWWGCQKVSPGCTNCYADSLAARWGKKIWGPKTDRDLKSGIWQNIRKWDTGERTRMFTMSMGDFFEDHDQLVDVRRRAMDLLESLRTIDVQLLTKRPANIETMGQRWMRDWPRHIWVGTSVEDQDRADERIPMLRTIPAAIRFLSVEPLLGPVDLDLDGIHWVIVGGESGRKARPMSPDWVRSVRDQCESASVPLFFKQWGEYNSAGQRVGKKISGASLDGIEYRRFPA